jgi:hypothetical protein
MGSGDDNRYGEAKASPEQGPHETEGFRKRATVQENYSNIVRRYIAEELRFGLQFRRYQEPPSKKRQNPLEYKVQAGYVITDAGFGYSVKPKYERRTPIAFHFR